MIYILLIHQITEPRRLSVIFKHHLSEFLFYKIFTSSFINALFPHSALVLDFHHTFHSSVQRKSSFTISCRNGSLHEVLLVYQVIYREVVVLN